jgi:hypothetical protein
MDFARRPMYIWAHFERNSLIMYRYEQMFPVEVVERRDTLIS